MVSEPRRGATTDPEGCPRSGVCGAVSLAVAVFAVGVGYSLVGSTLVAVPELAAAAAVYVVFLVWGLGWLLLAAGYHRANGAVARRRSRDGT
jgi:hypothetical protein